MKAIHSIENGDYQKKKSNLLRNLSVVGAVLIILAAITLITIAIVKRWQETHITVGTLEKHWVNKDYKAVYDDGKLFLDYKPFNNSALIYYGYAAFYLAVGQTDSSVAQNYIDDSINALRRSLTEARENIKPQIYYMLGRAYFYKNTNPSHYYSDLAIKYLNLAKECGYEPDPNDIPELLGMSYAALGMTMESISSFTEALLVRETDNLLLSIAEQYYKSGEKNAAKMYLTRIVSSTEDDELILKSRCLLGNIYLEDGDFEEAEAEFTKILEINENYADAIYGLGLIYEAQDKMVLARAQWRKVLKIAVNHAGALKKMAEK